MRLRSFDPGALCSSSGKDQLAKNDFAYRQLRSEIDRLHQSRDPALLPLIERTAQLAWLSHPGRLADGALENPLLEIGLAIQMPPASAASAPTAGSRTLHVASQLYPTGGHSRILAKWVNRDLSSSHAIVLTRQDEEIPQFMTSIAAERSAPIITLDRHASIQQRAMQLRALSRDYDRVILHQHPDDAVPVLAYAVPGGCPVAMFNHAHFWFSLGTGVADMVINTTPYFMELTKEQRFPREIGFLHGPPGLEQLGWTDIDKRLAKQRLGLDADAPVAMTIGHESYFAPVHGTDFFVTLSKLLDFRTDLSVLVVGVGHDSTLVPSSLRATGRVHFVGPVADPRPYYEAADICLESFPMPSLGALIEAPAYGQAFPVPAFSQTQNPRCINQPQIARIAVRQRTEAEYLAYIDMLLSTPNTTMEKAGDLRRSLISDDERFGDQFAVLYERLAALGHAPRSLPRTDCAYQEANLSLALMTSSHSIGFATDILPSWRKFAIQASAVMHGYQSTHRAFLTLLIHFIGLFIRKLPIQFQKKVKLWRRLVI